MFAKRHLFFLLVFALVACSQPRLAADATPTTIPTPTIPTPAPGTLVVDPSLAVGSVSPYLLGSNYGPWVAVPFNMLAAAYDSRVTAVRFPGGAWGDRNNLKSYHIDSFIDFTRQVGAIPTISARLRQGTPQQAADLVRYVNIEKQYGVAYWSIGNEPTLFAAELRTIGQANDYDTVQFNKEWREFALAMRAVDPTIKLLGPEIHQFTGEFSTNPKDSSGRDWMIEFLKANGDLVDVVTFHRYPFPRSMNDTVTIDDLRRHTKEWAKTIPYLRQLIAEHTGREIPIAITEMNTHYNPALGGEATPDSHYNAIWLAETLGQLMRQDLFMLNHWMLTSQGGQGGWGLIGRGVLRPSYYVYQLYSQFGAELVYADSGTDDVSIYAARRADNALTLMVINLADTAKSVKLQIAGELPAQAELWRLDQAQLPEVGLPFALPKDGTLSLPAQSLSLFALR